MSILLNCENVLIQWHYVMYCDVCSVVYFLKKQSWNRLLDGKYEIMFKHIVDEINAFK